MYSVLPLLFVVTATPIDTSERLLDEVVAGFDASHALIIRGYAEYEIAASVTETPSKPQGNAAKPKPFKATVHFDGVRVRWDYQDWRCVRDGQRDILFNAPFVGGQLPLAAPNYSVHIYEVHGASTMYPYWCHPRWLGHSVNHGGGARAERTISDTIRDGRKNENVRLSAMREGTLIKVSTEFTGAGARRDYWVDPVQGYSVTRMALQTLKQPGAPAWEVQTEYEAATNGAFIAKKHSHVNRRWKDGKWFDAGNRQTVLVLARLDESPDEKLFTIDGLGVPKGAHIQDHTTGKVRLHGIIAEDQKAIDEKVSSLLLEHAQPSLPWGMKVGLYGGIAATFLVLALIAGILVRRARGRSESMTVLSWNIEVAMPDRKFAFLLCVLVGVGLLLAAGLSRTRPASSVRKTDIQPNQEPPVGAQRPTVLTCREPLKDFSEVTEQKLVHTFSFENQTERGVRISKLGKSCACLDIILSTNVLGPRGSATLKVTLYITPAEPGRVAAFRERVLLHTEDDGEPLALELVGRYLPDVYCLSPRVNLLASAEAGQPFSGNLELFLNKRRDVDIKQVAWQSPFEMKSQTLKRGLDGDGVFEKVTIAFTGERPNGELPQIGLLEIHTTSRNQPVLTLPIHLFASGPAIATCIPARLAFGVVKPGQTLRRFLTLRVLRSANLSIDTIAAPCEAVKAGSRRLDHAGEWELIQIECVLDTDKLVGDLVGDLTVRLRGNPGPKTIVVPLSAFLKQV